MYNLDTKILIDEQVNIEVKNRTSLKIRQLDTFKHNVFLSLAIYNKEAEVLLIIFTACQTKLTNIRGIRLIGGNKPINSYANFKDLSGIIDIDLDIETEMNEDGKMYLYSIKLKNQSPNIGFFINLKLKDSEGELIKLVFWSDNYVNILPGKDNVVQVIVEKYLVENKNLCLEVPDWNSVLLEKQL